MRLPAKQWWMMRRGSFHDSPVFKCHVLFLFIRYLYCRGGVLGKTKWGLGLTHPPPTVPTNKGIKAHFISMAGVGPLELV
jgi:hypothetical protein